MPNFIERPRYFCALGGAMETLSALPEVVPILHAAPGCAGNITWTQNGGSGLQVGGYCAALAVPSSNVQEKEVVFGGLERLREEIRNTLEIIEGRLYFVITGCVTEVIGDDVKSVVNEFQHEEGPDGAPRIIHAETGGFKGNSYYGYDLVFQSLFKNYLQRDVPKVKKRVNIWGIVPFMDVFWRGNIEGVRTLLEKLGLEVNSFFTAADSLDEIRGAAGAELNIVLSDVYGVEAAEVFKEIHGTSYIQLPLPVGPAATDQFLQQVSEALSLDKRATDQFIAAEHQQYYHYLEPLIEGYNDLDLQRYTIVIGDVNYAVALTKFLADDLGWLPELVVFTDQLNEDQKQKLVVSRFDLKSGLKPNVIFETDTSEILRHFKQNGPEFKSQKYYNAFSPAFVVGSSLDRDLAQSIGAAHLSVSFPVANRVVIDRGYTGYRGGLRLIEDLLSSIIIGR
jgi:nitrogenase molybdenum-iron protein beta chain